MKLCIFKKPYTVGLKKQLRNYYVYKLVKTNIVRLGTNI